MTPRNAAHAERVLAEVEAQRLKCIDCGKPFGVLETRAEWEDGDVCEGCDAKRMGWEEPQC